MEIPGKFIGFKQFSSLLESDITLEIVRQRGIQVAVLIKYIQFVIFLFLGNGEKR